MKTNPLMGTQPSVASVARRIRALRKERGWSLSDVEGLSHGAIKAVVLGSYERGDRALSLHRLIELAEIFQIPLTHLIDPGEKSVSVYDLGPLMIDLRALKRMYGDHVDSREPSLVMLMTFATWIAGQRSDWNGEIMTLRNSDVATLALMSSVKTDDLLSWLAKSNLLLKEPSRF